MEITQLDTAASLDNRTDILQEFADSHAGLAGIQDEWEQPRAAICAKHCMPGYQIYYFEVDVEENAGKRG